MILDYRDKFLKCVTKIGELGEQYSEAKSKSWYSQELKHSVLSSIMKKFDGPISQKEMEAKASEDYKSYLAETRDAIREELRLKSLYEKEKSIFESLRSLCALEKHTKDL